jgi:general secretion pathway protein D
MASHLNRIARLLAIGAALALAGCAAQSAYRDGEKLVADDKIEAGLVKYKEAIALDPGNALYRTSFLAARDRSTIRLVDLAERELAAGNSELAAVDYRRALAIDPANERARAGLRLLEADARHAILFDDASAAFARGDVELARQKLAAVLSERPNHEPARLLLAQVVEKTALPAGDTGLGAAYKLPISIEFRDATLKQIFEVISRRSGLNFLFDKDVKTDQRTSIFLKNSTVEAAIYYLLVSNQLEQQVMDGNTILVYQNIPTKLKEYQEMTVKTYFLANAEAKNVANTLKTILKTRDVVVDEKLNLLIVRDSPEAIKLATRLVALQDVAEPEVMLDVEILEIKRSRLMDLGIAWPSSLGFAPLQAASGGGLTIEALRHLNGDNIGVSGVAATINANKTDGDSNTLANPRIRVRNKEKAKVVIGDKVPVITTIITPGTSGGFASEAVSYVDVGLTLNVEPTIYLNNEIAIRIALEVSNLVDSVTTKSGSVAYRIGTRSATTMLQLKDGENQVLAGLISNADQTSGSKVPGLGSLPILGRLFGSTRDSNDKNEIVLSITPHLVRNVQRPALGASEFSAGTETSFRRRPDPAARAPAQLPASPGGRTNVVAPAATTVTTPSASLPAVPSAVPASSLPAVPTGALPAVPPSTPAGVTITPVPAPAAAPAPTPAPNAAQ